VKTKAQKWGNSLAVRIPRNVVQEIGLKPQDALTIEVQKGRIVLVPMEKAGKIPHYRLEDLVKKITRKNRYKEVDFGAPVGREIW
jgi:antitoxin MazE